MNILAHPSVGEKPSFVYSITMLPETNELVSVGEDGNCCIWNDEQIAQTIKLPSYSREVISLANGDIVVTNGRNAFVFSRNPERSAKSLEIAQFEALFEQKQTGEQIKHSDSRTILRPGNKNGQIAVVKRSGNSVVYRWEESIGGWELVGSANGVAGENQKKRKHVVDGREYDHIVNIDFDGKDQAVLGFNVD
ncbi:WD repeat protein Lub1, partial [Bonamia ostreae]